MKDNILTVHLQAEQTPLTDMHWNKQGKAHEYSVRLQHQQEHLTLLHPVYLRTVTITEAEA